MSGSGHTRSFGDVGLVSGLPESGHGWTIKEYTPECPSIPKFANEGPAR
jgi:hypothetical protein